MARSFRLLQWAELELDEAIRYYEQERPGLGFELFERYEAAVHQALSFPEAPSPIAHGRLVRPVGKVILEQFPYSLIVTRMNDEVVVVALAHQKRRPGYWRKRLGKAQR